MEFFKFNPTSDTTTLERGQILNDLSSAMWVERYSEPGECSFEAQLSTGIASLLPLGTIVSHVDTLEVMIIESQQIKEKTKEDPTVIVTGRSFPSYLEQRVVGMNLARSSSTIAPYNLTADKTWNQVKKLINDHIKDTGVVGDKVIDIEASTTLSGAGESIARTIDRGYLWPRVSELLAIEELGIRTRRKNSFSGSPVGTILDIYRGDDKTADVLFSWDEGDLDSAEYLLSLKNNKNSAMVVGQYIWTVVDLGPTNYSRRVMIVDASDIDGDAGALPTGGTLTTMLAAMVTRGRQALAKQNTITINQADVSKTTKYDYRRDYNMGDLITLDGDFNQMQVMRVIEYAEIEDENGESGHPTFAPPLT